ncbi:MAG: HAD-IA family hydrolase [Muribaculaceae bacterium]|nr:HAD-IA family hydrolase [Muribaculaceae bacterium]
MKEYEAYLFDFDYTLADSSRGIVMCFQDVLNRAGYTHISDDAIKRTIGLTLEEAFAEMTGVTDAATLARWRKEYVSIADKVMNDATMLFPEVTEVLARLKEHGAKTGIISTKYRYRIENFLLRHFDKLPVDIIIGGEDVNTPKPSPEGVIETMKRLGVKSENVLYCGDSIVDAATAFNAGVDFAAIIHGVTPRSAFEPFPHVFCTDNLVDILPGSQPTA